MHAAAAVDGAHVDAFAEGPHGDAVAEGTPIAVTAEDAAAWRAADPRVTTGGTSVDAAAVDSWLAELGLVPVERSERERTTSWDLVLDGHARQDVRLTLILDPAVALVAWVHFAPPLNDSFRVSYRQFLRWNDELPFVKFALSADDRPVLTSELAVVSLDRDALGVAIVRLLSVCDLVVADSVRWLWPGRKDPPAPTHPARCEGLFARYADVVPELVGGGNGQPREDVG